MQVYKIESEKTGEVVFTSTWVDAKMDWDSQIGLLRRGIHPKISLQNHFNKYGEKDLIFSTGKDVKKTPEVKIEKAVIPEQKTEVTIAKEPEKVKEVKHRTKKQK